MLKHFAMGLVLAFCLAGVAKAAPPGDLPYGAYDPGGDYIDDPVPVIEHIFLPWEDVYLPSLAQADAYALARKRALLVTLEPWTWSRSERNTAQYLMSGIVEGRYDENMRGICHEFSLLKSPVTLRWAHEMEDTSGQFIWAGWNPQTYINAYRRMITICREAAPNIQVMWSPAGNEGLEAYYPGDEYVDIVGISVFGYEPYDLATVGRAQSYLDVLAPKYARAAKFGKPVVVAELGFSGSQAYVDAWDKSIRVTRAEYPNLVGVVYFDQREVYPWPNNFGFPDWRLDNRVIK